MYIAPNEFQKTCHCGILRANSVCREVNPSHPQRFSQNRCHQTDFFLYTRPHLAIFPVQIPKNRLVCTPEQQLNTRLQIHPPPDSDTAVLYFKASPPHDHLRQSLGTPAVRSTHRRSGR
jgi:hypothetical protein